LLDHKSPWAGPYNTVYSGYIATIDRSVTGCGFSPPTQRGHEATSGYVLQLKTVATLQTSTAHLVALLTGQPLQVVVSCLQTTLMLHANTLAKLCAVFIFDAVMMYFEQQLETTWYK